MSGEFVELPTCMMHKLTQCQSIKLCTCYSSIIFMNLIFVCMHKLEQHRMPGCWSFSMILFDVGAPQDPKISYPDAETIVWENTWCIKKNSDFVYFDLFNAMRGLGLDICIFDHMTRMLYVPTWKKKGSNKRKSCVIYDFSACYTMNLQNIQVSKVRMKVSSAILI